MRAMTEETACSPPQGQHGQGKGSKLHADEFHAVVECCRNSVGAKIQNTRCSCCCWIDHSSRRATVGAHSLSTLLSTCPRVKHERFSALVHGSGMSAESLFVRSRLFLLTGPCAAPQVPLPIHGHCVVCAGDYLVAFHAYLHQSDSVRLNKVQICWRQLLYH